MRKTERWRIGNSERKEKGRRKMTNKERRKGSVTSSER